MNNPETVSESFIAWIESMEIATFNTNLFLGEVPASAPDTCYWVLTNGGSPIQKLRTGEKIKQYFISVYYRSTKGKNIERELFNLEELLNSSGCLQLQGFEVVEIQANQFPSDIDLDNEDRRIGMLQATIMVYKTD